MKKAMAMLLLMLLLGSCVVTGAQAKTFVTSFYPMYIFTLNVTKDVPDVSVVTLAGENVGCLHDYQLNTRDMARLEKADALIINGGGMEQFMDRVAQQQKNLAVINASEGIEMLCAEGEDDHDHDHDHGVVNAHVWMDPALAIHQVQRIADGLAALDAPNAAVYQQNAAAYIQTIEALDAKIREMLAPIAGREIITFHESFTYFAHAYGIEIAAVMAGDSGDEPSTREIARLCDLVKGKDIHALFVEPQYPAKAAGTIARETGAQVVTLNPVVSGDGALNSYETLMQENARVLMEALVP